MTTSRTSLLRKKWPLLALVLAAILALILVIWQLQTSPETNDAYVYADTIDVVPEVSGRIVEMPIRDNQRVKKGDLLFRIDPRPYQAMLDDAKARLTTSAPDGSFAPGAVAIYNMSPPFLSARRSGSSARTLAASG